VNNWRCTWHRFEAHLEWDLYLELTFRQDSSSALQLISS
jgi:hypothetical protein